jgi:predicted nucleic acid-binding protein
MNADRISLDANILFSIAYGSPGLNRLWELAQRKRCVLFASNYVVEEAKRNLFSSEPLRNLEAFLSRVQLVPDIDPNIPCPIKLPEKDRPVLLAAIFTKANYLLTGDIIQFGKYFGQTVRGIKICLPRDYPLIAQQRKTKR